MVCLSFEKITPRLHLDILGALCVRQKVLSGDFSTGFTSKRKIPKT